MHRIANDRFEKQDHLPTILQSLTNRTAGKVSNQSMEDMKRLLSELVTRFEIEKGDMEPQARRRWRDRFLRLGQALPPALKRIATTLADVAFKLPQGQSILIP